MAKETPALPAVPKALPETKHLEGTQFYRTLRHASQPALLRGSDDKLYLVEWDNSVTRPSALANEVIGQALFKAVGLHVPSWKPFFASNAFIDGNPDMWPAFTSERPRIASGFHFASEFLDTERTFIFLPFLPSSWRGRVLNPHDLLGAYIMDIWTGSDVRRRVLFRTGDGNRSLKAFFVGNGDLFGGSRRPFGSGPGAALSWNQRIYAAAWDEAAVLSWIAKIGMGVRNPLNNLSALVPEYWQRGNADSLAETLSSRLNTLEDLVTQEFRTLGYPLFIHKRAANLCQEGLARA